MDLDRLRELAKEPDRTAMSRAGFGQFPTMTSEVLRQKQEINALRRGLWEAITEIETLLRDRDAELKDRMKRLRWEKEMRDE